MYPGSIHTVYSIAPSAGARAVELTICLQPITGRLGVLVEQSSHPKPAMIHEYRPTTTVPGTKNPVSPSVGDCDVPLAQVLPATQEDKGEMLLCSEHAVQGHCA